MFETLKSNIPLLSNSTENDLDSPTETKQEQSDVEDSSGSSNSDADTSVTDPTNALVSEEIYVYRDKMVIDGKFARTYAVDNWPPMMNRGVFTSLIMNAGLDFDFSLHVSPYDNISAVDKLEKLETKLNDKRTGEFERFTPNKESIMNTEQTLSAMKQHVTSGQTLVDASFLITVYAETEDALEYFHGELQNELDRSAQMNTNKCLFRQKEAFQSNNITGRNKMGELNDSMTQLMLGDALSKTFPFIEDTFMEEGGVLFGINENSRTPAIVDVFDRSNGYNMLTTGMIGSGKSFSSSQILLDMDASYQDFQQYIIDPMGGFLGVNNALDGDRIIINGTESINPMEIEETPEHVIEQSQGQIDPWGMKKQELRWFFTQFFSMRADETLSNEELSTLDTAITQTYARFGITEDIETHSKESPTILDLMETLEMIAEDAEDYSSTDLKEEVDKRRRLAINLLVALDPFEKGGEYHNLAQKTDVRLTDNRVIYLDMQQIPENSDDLGIMMQLLFMKLFQRAKSSEDKIAMTIDEAHKIMGDESMTTGLEEMFRHSRHFDLSINLISQTPEEFYSTETAKTIAKQCTIKRFHRVDSLDIDFAKEHLDMNNREINYIENAEMGEGSKDYSQALLRISDEDRSIPLRIKATRDEQMIIDYDPSEDVSDYSNPADQRLKQALDTYNNTNDPIFVGDEESLTMDVKAEIARKERNKKRVLASEDKSLLSESDREEFEQNDVRENGESSGDRSPESESESNTDLDTDDSDPVGLRGIKRRLGSPEQIENLENKHIDRVASQYLDDPADDTDENREKLKNELFDVDVSSD